MATEPRPEEEIPFDPVPSKTGRSDGWTPERQRLFIAVLAKTGLSPGRRRRWG